MFHVSQKKKSQYCSHVTVLLIVLCDSRRGKTSTRTNNRHLVSKTPIDLSPQSNSVNFIYQMEQFLLQIFANECRIMAAILA
jgi:hypothetical protein